MHALTLIIHIFLGSTLAGTAIIVALVSGFDTALAIATAGAAGFFVAFPASWLIARRLSPANPRLDQDQREAVRHAP